MLKLILISIYGKKVLSSRAMFNSVKSYLIFYMMLLPAFMNARDISRASEVQLSNELTLKPAVVSVEKQEIKRCSRDLQGAFLEKR